jgi:hypothetical protein
MIRIHILLCLLNAVRQRGLLQLLDEADLIHKDNLTILLSRILLSRTHSNGNSMIGSEATLIGAQMQVYAVLAKG